MGCNSKGRRTELNMTHEPIPTEHFGIFFRSRLEARWAIFFDLIGLKYEYEPDCFDLNGNWYTPDFLLLDHVFAEVKPTYWHWNQASYMSLIVNKTKKPFLALIGLPHFNPNVLNESKWENCSFKSQNKNCVFLSAEFAKKCRFDNGKISYRDNLKSINSFGIDLNA